MGIISTKLRKSAKGQACTFQIPGVCSGDPETTVLCHAPSEVKGLGNKSHDYHAAFGCVDCHTALDQHRLPKDQELFFWLRGLARTQDHWVQAGLMIVPADVERPKVRPKKKSKWPSRPIQSRGFAKTRRER